MSVSQASSLWKEALSTQFEQTIAWRRYLHQNPELSYEESKTATFVANQLRSFGIEVETGIGGNGLIGRIRNGDGAVVALRADMDALPIQDEKQCDYRSQVPGVMHACGHDGHTATLLSVAKVLSEQRSLWTGEIRLLFQPAEEVSPGGAQAMIRDGALEGVNRIYGVHLWTPIPTGIVATREGSMMAAVDDFRLTIAGKGGHGGMPHLCTDAVLIGASLVQQLQSIVSRNVSPLQPAVISVGSLQAGTTQNIIADRAELKGTIRSFDPEVRQLLRQRFERIVELTCAMHEAEYEMEFRVGYPALVNDGSEAERVFRIADEVVGQDCVREAEMMMPAEDFAYYVKQIPGCFVLVGAGNEDHARYPHHHPKFDFEESAMLIAGQMLIGLAMDALAEQK
ncbi:M20 family metallopeptidase [Paenibacillus alvei]|uniref:M20 family metallopeptidase n=1 Tax=Paenibacillus alvei TaxID=44250 RepID=A0ABT4GUX5_PAEAL|nr:M20 family metallopeptidase [Paenibacillus alvei]EJW17502.1 putative amidohydrolase YhaA [Paenibacillus alvei DSM 29]MCY9540379.1 M20 family metallopeptidase [Paenibacillus alvei]MCY9705852.1 M20 family metallopeptidase [Paenibacillus alvei]MCY9737065.1 M20 family metallopeptidase [Paenibacillus alvei]MCY9753453.1 M20 family metallopeptidase [Paenibacillus alvei]